MRDWLQRCRPNGVLDRICVHGQAHPDPDQFALWVARGWERFAVHECDGCCAHEGCVQIGHRTAADVESELSLLRTVRDVLTTRGVSAPGPELEESLRTELRRMRGRGENH